jgi:hypothetical protein
VETSERGKETPNDGAKSGRIRLFRNGSSRPISVSTILCSASIVFIF